MNLRQHPSRYRIIGAICLWSVLGLTVVSPVVSDTNDTEHGDHSAHHQQTHDHSMHDHSAHAGHQTEGDDPHAHHRAMMNQSGYRRSEKDYALHAWRLVDMQGRKTDLMEALDCGHPVMVNFIFTTCTTICPVMSATFAQVQSELGPAAQDVCMISFSIDPEYDTPARLREYAERFDAGPQWQFYTGDLGDLIAVQKAFDVYRGNKMNHEPTTLLRNSQDTPWIRLDGIASAAEIVNEYEKLQYR